MGLATEIVSVILHRIHALLTTLLLFIVSLGPIPRHVGFVMDGNRRYARGKGLETARGHSDGFQSLRRTLEVCLKLKIPVVSIYAFSIDNFQRDQEEVEHLFDLGRTKLTELCQHGDLLNQYGIRMRWVGRRDMLPDDLKEASARMEEMTSKNTSGILNICSPYTSRDEITTAIRDTAESSRAGKLDIRNIDTDEVFSHLGTTRTLDGIRDDKGDFLTVEKGGHLDLLVRTSNVRRLSDFMMWQASEDTQLHFVKVNWPEFGLTDMLPILLGWQQKIWLRKLQNLVSI